MEEQIKINRNTLEMRIGRDASTVLMSVIQNQQILKETINKLHYTLKGHLNDNSREITDTTHRFKLVFKLIDDIDRKIEATNKALRGKGITDEVYDELFRDALEMTRIVAITGETQAEVMATEYNFR